VTGRPSLATQGFVKLTGRPSLATQGFVKLTGRPSLATQGFVNVTGRFSAGEGRLLTPIKRTFATARDVWRS
jgi:hypothetical protein